VAENRGVEEKWLRSGVEVAEKWRGGGVEKKWLRSGGVEWRGGGVEGEGRQKKNKTLFLLSP
jgi:hypothetical protein